MEPQIILTRQQDIKNTFIISNKILATKLVGATAYAIA